MYEANHVERMSHHGTFYTAFFGAATDNHWGEWNTL